MANQPAASTSQAAVPKPLDESIADEFVGSLLGPIKRIRDGTGFGTCSFASDKYKPSDHAAWQKEMRQAVMDDLFYKPAKCDMAVEIVERIDCGKYWREKIYFNTTPALRVPAYVLVPKNLKDRAPGILGLHDHGGFFQWGMEKLVKMPGEHPSLTAFKKECYAGHSIADDLAEQGYVVMVAEMFYWGERRMRLPGMMEREKMAEGDVRRADKMLGDASEKICRRIYNAGLTWTGLVFWDDIRCLDYLQSRADVDPERLGCVGLSIGSFRSGHLAALDERIKAAIECCWLTSFCDISANNGSHTAGFTRTIPGIYQKLDVPDIISLTAPRALLCQNGLKDNLYPVEVGVKPAYALLEKVWAKLGVPEKFKGHLYDTPHEFNEEMQAEAWAWLKKFV